jgi:hypothetical protein
MTEIERIEDQLKRSLEGEAWHGPAVEELLSDVTAERAAAKPAPSVHSVWEIVLHIISDQRLVCERLQGKPTVLPAEEDWPPITDQSEAGLVQSGNFVRVPRDCEKQSDSWMKVALRNRSSKDLALST